MIVRCYDEGMGTPFRTGPEDAIQCPRCAKELPPRDVAPCITGCGTWVSAFAATEVLTEGDRTEDSITRWWRVRAPCPHCREKMTLRGEEPGFLQGCDVHGFWIDADAVRFTGLKQGVDEAALDAKRADTERVEAERAARYALERERAQRKSELERLEAQLDKQLEPGPSPYAPELEPRTRSPVSARPSDAEAAAARSRTRRMHGEASEDPDHVQRMAAATRDRRRAYLEMVVTAIRSGNAEAIADELVQLRDRVAVLEEKLVHVLASLSEGRT